MPNSAEPKQSMVVTIIMLLMIITSIVGFMWCIKHGIEKSYPSKQIKNQQ